MLLVIKNLCRWFLKLQSFFFSYCIHVTSVNTDFFFCVCVCEITPTLRPFLLLTSLHICIRSLNTTGPTLPLSCVLPVCIFDSKRCASACLNNTHTSSEMVPSPLQMWRRALTKRDGCVLDFNVFCSVFFSPFCPIMQFFLLNFGVRIHQGDKWNPFKKEKINQNWEAASHWRLVQKQKSCCEKGWQRMEGSDTATV